MTIPDKIYAGPWLNEELSFAHRTSAEETCYVREDLVAALVDALKGVLAEAEFVSPAHEPFTTWVATQCRATLKHFEEGKGEGK